MNHSFPDINECLVNNPCLNDAICENTPGSYICRCKPGFEGNLCQYSEYMNSIHTYNVHVHNHVFYQISLLHDCLKNTILQHIPVHCTIVQTGSNNSLKLV